MAKVEFLGDVTPHQGRRHSADGGGFGGVGEAAQNRSHDDDGDQQRGAGADGSAGPLAQGAVFAAWVVVEEAHAGDHDEKQQGEQDAGDDAGDQHVAHGHLGQHAVHDEHHRRRNDGAQHAAVDREARRKGFVVALFLHLGHHHLRHDGHLGRGGADDGRHHHVGQNVHVGQAPFDRANEGHGQVHQPPRDAAAVHDFANQDEQRDRDQAVAVHTREHLQRK